MGDATSRPGDGPGDRWRLRSVPDHLAARYVAEGWWTDDTLGMMVAEGLSHMGDVGFRVRSAVRPWQGTFAEVDRAARSLAGALAARGVGPGDVVMFQIPNWVEAGITFWAAAYLGAVVVPVVHFYGPKEVDYILGATSPDVIVTADRFGHNDFVATYDELLADRPEPLWLVTTGDRTRRSAGAGHGLRVAARPRAHRRAGGGRPGCAGRHRVHLGYDPRSQGGDPLAPHDRVRDPPARVGLPHRRTPADHRRAGRALHRHAQRLPGPHAAGARREPDRRLGSGRGAAHDERGGPRGLRWRHLLPHQPARPSGLHRRAPGPHALRRSRGVDRPGGGHRAGHEAGHEGVAVLRQHRASVHHRQPPRRARGQADHHRRAGPRGRRDPPRPRRPDPQPRARTASSATPIRS